MFNSNQGHLLLYGYDAEFGRECIWTTLNEEISLFSSGREGGPCGNLDKLSVLLQWLFISGNTERNDQ